VFLAFFKTNIFILKMDYYNSLIIACVASTFLLLFKELILIHGTGMAPAGAGDRAPAGSPHGAAGGDTREAHRRAGSEYKARAAHSFIDHAPPCHVSPYTLFIVISRTIFCWLSSARLDALWQKRQAEHKATSVRAQRDTLIQLRRITRERQAVEVGAVRGPRIWSCLLYLEGVIFLMLEF
jgi:hypothetical protein